MVFDLRIKRNRKLNISNTSILRVGDVIILEAPALQYVGSLIKLVYGKEYHAKYSVRLKDIVAYNNNGSVACRLYYTRNKKRMMCIGSPELVNTIAAREKPDAIIYPGSVEKIEYCRGARWIPARVGRIKGVICLL